MTGYAVFLRGVNVGKGNRIAMAALRQSLAQDGFENVRSYLASGNLVLASELDEAGLAERVRAVIREQFGFDVSVMVRSAADLRREHDANPYRAQADSDPKSVHLVFLERAGEPGELLGEDAGDANVTLNGRAGYLCTPEGLSNSELVARLTRKGRLNQVGTGRNWRTVQAMLALVESA